MTITSSTQTLKLLTTNNKKNIAVIGVGYIGQPLFFELSKEYNTIGVSKNKHLDQPFIASEGSKEKYIDILTENDIDTLVICWAPSSRTEESYKETYIESLNKLCQAFKAKPPKHVIYTSSSGVYAKAPNRVANENDTYFSTEPTQKILKEAEYILLSQAKKIGFKCCIMRLTGLYGPKRIPCLRLLEKNEPLPGNSNSWLNLIHRDDAISAIKTCIKEQGEGIYNIRDNQPYLKRELYKTIAEVFKSNPPYWQENESEHTEGKSVVCEKFKNDFNWEPEYPDIDKFLREIL
jgi:nucleoside-diphosphate-sugar epimerase